MANDPTPHKFRAHTINPDTEILIVGTFNPDTAKNKADFFYGTGRNDLWKLVPRAFEMESLKTFARYSAAKRLVIQEKRLKLMRDKRIDFIDIIAEVNAEANRTHDRKDSYIGWRVSKWNSVGETLDNLLKLKRICFTRKTFAGVALIEAKVKEIAEYCERRSIYFQCLISPSGAASGDKQSEWTAFFNPTDKLASASRKLQL